jgi:hypothetical protein
MMENKKKTLLLESFILRVPRTRWMTKCRGKLIIYQTSISRKHSVCLASNLLIQRTKLATPNLTVEADAVSKAGMTSGASMIN